MFRSVMEMTAVADPGFPVGGGVDLVGGRGLRGGYVSKNLYVKTKESAGPLEGCVAGHAPSRSANGQVYMSRAARYLLYSGI